MVHSAWESSLHLVPGLYPSCAEITAHAINGAVEERREERTKTPYSLDINLITMRLSIAAAANRRVVNRFPYSMSRTGRTTSRCPSPCHARSLSLIFDSVTDLVKTFDQDHHSFVAECCTHFLELQPIPRGVTFSKALSKLKAQSSPIERLFLLKRGKRDARALSFELRNSIRKCHPKWDRLYSYWQEMKN